MKLRMLEQGGVQLLPGVFDECNGDVAKICLKVVLRARKMQLLIARRTMAVI